MHRFTRALKKAVKFFNNEVKTLAVGSFSLLVNCTDFQSSKRIFSLMCKVFKSEFTDDSVLSAKAALQAVIVGRPSDSTEMRAIIQEIFENEGTQVSENVNDIDIVVDHEYGFKNNHFPRKLLPLKNHHLSRRFLNRSNYNQLKD